MYELKSSGRVAGGVPFMRRAGCFVPFIFFGGAVLAFAVTGLFSGGDGMVLGFIPTGCLSPILFVVLPLLLLGGLGAAYFAARRLKLEAPRATLDVETLRVGQPFTLTYEQKAAGPAEVEEMTFILLLRETAKYRSGTDTVTVRYDHVVDTQRYPGRSLQPGGRLFQEVRMRIPANGMHNWGLTGDLQAIKARMAAASAPTNAEAAFDRMQDQAAMRGATGVDTALPDGVPDWVKGMARSVSTLPAGHNALQWFVTAQVKVKGWIDYHEEYALQVLPERFGEAEAAQPADGEA
ncbi:MAG: hypothetical protein IT326_01165 [Anaerolineae bacterium]|nr:hypothetical protein [Anaerolineae bacterium]